MPGSHRSYARLFLVVLFLVLAGVFLVRLVAFGVDGARVILRLAVLGRRAHDVLGVLFCVLDRVRAVVGLVAGRSGDGLRVRRSALAVLRGGVLVLGLRGPVPGAAVLAP